VYVLDALRSFIAKLCNTIHSGVYCVVGLLYLLSHYTCVMLFLADFHSTEEDVLNLTVAVCVVKIHLLCTKFIKGAKNSI